MNEEVKEALARWRSYDHDDKTRQHPYDQDNGLCMEGDMCLLSDAMIEIHPADDDEPLTEDWLGACGAVPVIVPSGTVIHRFRIEDGCDENEIYLYIHEPDSDGERPVDLVSVDGGKRTGVGITAKWPRTRGDLRLLCRALGIDLPTP